MNPLRAWNAFWFAPVSARPLGAFRVAYGVVVLASLVILTADFDHWFTGAGLLRGTEAREAAGPLRPSVLQWTQEPAAAWGVLAATAAAAALFTLGWRTRWMAILLYLGLLSLHHRNIATACGADQLMVITAFYLMLSPCGASYSLDARRRARRRGTVAEPLIVPWAQRLMQLQLSLVYLNTAVLKSSGPTWLDGSALHYVLNNGEFCRYALGPLGQSPIAINAMTFSALLIEFALAFLLWSRATRAWAIALGVALHGAILVTVNIPIFGELMMASYLTFLAPDELDTLLRRLDPRNWLALLRGEPRAGGVTLPGRVDVPSKLRGPHQLQWDWRGDDAIEAETDEEDAEVEATARA